MTVAVSTFAADLVIWTALAVAIGGLVLNVWALLDARADLRAVRGGSRNGLLLMQASGDVGQEWRRVVIQLLLLAAAIVVAAATAPPDGARVAGRLLVLLVVVAVSEKALYARRVRRRMMRYDGHTDL